jgi:hypothetical protein
MEPAGAPAHADDAAASGGTRAPLLSGDVLRETDRWLDWREDGAHQAARATYRSEVPRHEWPVRPLDVREFLNFAVANEATRLVDGAASVLALGVLHVYVDWVSDPAGRLHQLCEEHSTSSLRSCVDEAYRLPTEVLVAVVWHLLTHIRALDAAAAALEASSSWTRVVMQSA